MMKRHSLLWDTHPLRALLEAWAVGLLLLLWLAALQTSQPELLVIGLFFLCGVAGTWAVLRVRVHAGGLRAWAYELAVASVLAGAMALLRFPAELTGLLAAWKSLGVPPLMVSAVLLGTGAGYLVWRVVVRVWLAWDRMRRRRMRWALTHAHLVLVVLAAACGAAALFLILPLNRTPALDAAATRGLFASAIARMLLEVFPALSIIIVLTVGALVFILPPSAIFSWVVVRQTTRRLETLARATAALRAGDYAARVAVSGEDELAQLQADFNAMADTLQRTLNDLQNERDNVATLLRSRRELVANVSHELRTPVATVRAVLDSLSAHWDEKRPEEARHDLAVAAGEVLRLQGLIDDLFTLSRAEVDALRLEVVPVDVSAIARQMAEAMAPLAWQAGRVEVLAESPANLPRARADAERLKQVAANLLRNAVRYTPPGGIVVISAAAEGDCLRLDVRDTGEGIAAEDLPRVWERFYRGRQRSATPDDGAAAAAAAAGPAEASAAPRSDGAGLGLALVKELTEAMGGSVAVESAPGQGACFTVRLPRAA